ncbi:MAG: gamma-glutamylcyclotransferase [Actinomycetia bacterium]|nr:gamma-glutamylcyclotransferase [Actinomycetes bacterium]
MDASFVIDNRGVTALVPRDGELWETTDEPSEPVAMQDRHAVLAYGSNADPQQLHGRLSPTRAEPVMVIRAKITGFDAAWCNARRGDGQVVSTLTARSGTHPTYVLMLTDDQRAEIDLHEGHPRWYQRSVLGTTVRLESGVVLPSVIAYIGTKENRPVLRDSAGEPLWMSAVDYTVVDKQVD